MDNGRFKLLKSTTGKVSPPVWVDVVLEKVANLNPVQVSVQDILN